MPYTVNACFNKFRSDVVELDATRCVVARGSRKNLIENIERLSENGSIPKLYPEKHVAYGSFARKTKIERLDDIDLMIAIDGDGATYEEIMHNEEYHLHTKNIASVLWQCIDENGINSRKVLNNFKDNLSPLHDYSRAEFHRNQEAVTLQLRSYEWNFDIVPCFYTNEGFCLIPDGKGTWKPTNPPVDQDNVTNANQNYAGQLLKLIRVMKYWKKINRISALSSYAFEVLIINFAKSSMFRSFAQSVHEALRYISSYVLGVIPDPKGFQEDLNELTLMQRYDASYKAQCASELAGKAIQAEAMGNQQLAISYWQRVFGNQFPSYGAY